MSIQADEAVVSPTTSTFRETAKWALSVTLYVGFQFFCSISLTLYNKWFLDVHHFSFPITVVVVHMTSVTLFCTILAFTCYRKLLADAREAWKGWRDFLIYVAPVGVLVSFDIVLSNTGFLSLSVAVVEMLKSATPVFILMLSFIAGLEKPSWLSGATILIISGGIALSSYRPVQFPVSGVLIVLTASAAGASRWILAESLMKGRHKLPPMVTLFYTAPVCVIALLPAFFGLELKALIMSPFFKKGKTLTSLALLLGSAPLAFLLHVSEFLLVSRTSVLTMCVAGVAKTMIIVVISIGIFGGKDEISVLNRIGFCTCMLGVGMYNYIRFLRHKKQFEELVLTDEAAVPLKQISANGASFTIAEDEEAAKDEEWGDWPRTGPILKTPLSPNAKKKMSPVSWDVQEKKSPPVTGKETREPFPVTVVTGPTDVPEGAPRPPSRRRTHEH